MAAGLGFNLFRRNFTERERPNLVYTVDRAVWSAIGGPDVAQVTATGKEDALWDLLETIRCPVELYDRNDEPIWWGFVESASISTGGLQIGVSIERMANRIRAVYSALESGGLSSEQQITEWHGHALSQTEYGVREKQLNLGQASESQALARVLTDLERLKFPIPTRRQANVRTRSATLKLRGWWDTLDWEYYEYPGGKESYETIGDGVQSVGEKTENQVAIQSFQLPAGLSWNARAVSLRARREGATADDLIVELCANGVGGPGTVLADSTRAGSTMADNLNWYEFVLSQEVLLQPETTYWIKVRRSGALDETNYYKVDGNEDCGYSRGYFRLWNGSAWVPRDPEIDMLFIVTGVEDSSDQLARIIGGGQFITGVRKEIGFTFSGVTSSPFRDGTRTRLAEAEALLQSGTTDALRILASLDRNRVVTLYPEPEPGVGDYMMDAAGNVYGPKGQLSPDYTPPGVWAALKDVIPGSLDSSRIGDPSRTFLEQTIYDSKRGLSWKERDAARLTDFGV